MVIGGVTAGQGHTNLLALIAIVWGCAFAGDLISYALGRRLGHGFLLRRGHLVKLTPARLGQVERFLARHGSKTIIVGRFIGLVRAVAPFVAGSANMPARRFVLASFAASGLWSSAFSILGYLFWQSFDEAAALAKQSTFALLALVVIIAGVVLAYRTLRTREGRGRLRHRLRRNRAHQFKSAWPTPPHAAPRTSQAWAVSENEPRGEPRRRKHASRSAAWASSSSDAA